VKVRGKCLAILEKAGRGELLAKLRISDALERKVLRLKVTLVVGR
jgi:hypothetical protein